MIYLSTGANGAGKTLFTLFDVRAQQLKEDRPVYYHGFKPLQPIHDFGWLPFEPEKWQDLPDGSICIFDEAQNEMPAKFEKGMPEWVNAIAQFRRARGFDFWIITPHPSMIHTNVRKLIESPSWHRHFKRTAGAELASELRFNFAETRCELPGAGKRAQVSMRAYPKEVYKWYLSTTLNTAKVRVPKQVFVLIGALCLVPVLGYFAYSKVIGSRIGGAQPEIASGQVQPAAQFRPGAEEPDYLSSYIPRVPGFPHTAPRFDEVTQPQQAPYPAACIASGKRCECYTQQATRLPVPLEVCAQVVAGGYFIEWLPPAQEASNAGFQREAAPTPQAVSYSPGLALLKPSIPYVNAR